jgi:hypothetical protein
MRACDPIHGRSATHVLLGALTIENRGQVMKKVVTTLKDLGRAFLSVLTVAVLLGIGWLLLYIKHQVRFHT